MEKSFLQIIEEMKEKHGMVFGNQTYKDLKTGKMEDEAKKRATKNKFRFWSNKDKKFIEPYRIKFLRCGRISNNFDIEISQSTGVIDCNFKEIFEGDIVRYKDTGYSQIVTWNTFDSEQGFSIDLDDWTLEIVGNIYEKKL